jgi:predicted AlkP superfamily phosphohydrolase/phosphomutase
MKKTLLVGLDAACWDYLEPLLDSGKMPTLQSLIDRGVSGTMRSTMPPWTPAAWASIVTGKNPGKHGIFDMTWKRPDSYEFFTTSAHLRSGTPFWKRLNDQGVRVGLVNVPFTYPPDAIEGFVVSGFGTPSSAEKVTYPLDLEQWIERQFGKYQAVVDPDILRSAAPLEILQAEVEHQARQVQIACRLSDLHQVDVLVINLMLTDHANHKMPEMQQVQEAYCHSDQDLKQLIEEFSPDNILLISDHGSNRLKGDFLLNYWLRDHGYLSTVENPRPERSKAINWILIQYFRHRFGRAGILELGLRRLTKELLLNLPDGLTKLVWNQIEQQIPFARAHADFSDQVDYRQTKLFPGSIYSGLLYFNVIGREPSGVLPVGDRGELAAEVASDLLVVREPGTGLPLFSNVYTGMDMYEGPALDFAPDLVLDSYDMGWNIRSTQYVPGLQHMHEGYFVSSVNRRDFGWHSRDGVFVFSGQDFIRGKAPDGAHVTDIASTLLHLYGIPVPVDYDGRVLLELMTPEHKQSELLTQSGDEDEIVLVNDDLSFEDSEALKDHLKALGYL